MSKLELSTDLSVNDSETNKTFYEEKPGILQTDDFELQIEKDVQINSSKFMGRNIKEKYPRWLGNNYVLFYKNDEPFILIGPHCKILLKQLGPFFLCLSTLINGMAFLFFYMLWDNLNDMIKFFGVAIAVLQFSTYLCTALVNPGIPSKKMSLHYYQNNIKFGNFRICNICNVIMDIDQNTSHCEDCNLCVEGKLFCLSKRL